MPCLIMLKTIYKRVRPQPAKGPQTAEVFYEKRHTERGKREKRGGAPWARREADILNERLDALGGWHSCSQSRSDSSDVDGRTAGFTS